MLFYNENTPGMCIKFTINFGKSWKKTVGWLNTVQLVYMERFGAPYIQKKTYKRHSSIPIHLHTHESGPGDQTLYADIPCIRTTL